MQSTPAYDVLNEDLFALLPEESRKFVDIGCMLGTMAKAVRTRQPDCSYIGIDIDEVYVESARDYCTKAILGDVEALPDEVWNTLFPSDCWILGDCLEHLRDPWSLLKKIRSNIAPGGAIAVCLPNAQHWSVQMRLATGQFFYEQSGLMDRTHLRWFTRSTRIKMFEDTGWAIEKGLARRLPANSQQQSVMEAIGHFAEICQFDPTVAKQDAEVFQYLFLCRALNS